MPGPIPNHKLNAIARMKVNGLDAEKMAGVVSLSVDQVKGVLSRGGEKFSKLVAQHENALIKKEVTHQIWLDDHLDEARDKIIEAMRGDDRRLANENAWKIHDLCIPKREKPQIKQEFNFNLRAENEFRDTVVQLGKEFVELKQVLATQDPMKHVKTGAEALPRAITVAVEPPKAENEKLELGEGDG